MIGFPAHNHEVGWGTVQLEDTSVAAEKGYERLIMPGQKLFTLPLQ